MKDSSMDQKLVQVAELEVPSMEEIQRITGLSVNKSYALMSVFDNQQNETPEKIVANCPKSYRTNEQIKPQMLKLAELIVAQRYISLMLEDTFTIKQKGSSLNTGLLPNDFMDPKLVQVSKLEVPSVEKIQRITGLEAHKSYALMSVFDNKQYETPEEIVANCPKSYRKNKKVKSQMLQLAGLIIAQRYKSMFSVNENVVMLKKLLIHEKVRAFLLIISQLAMHGEAQKRIQN